MVLHDVNHVIKVINVKVPKEVHKMDEEIIWPSYDPNPIIIRTTHFQSFHEGQHLSDTLIEFYLK